MSIVRLYKVLITKSYHMNEQGVKWSLLPWKRNTTYQEGFTLESHEYVLPDGYEIAESNSGNECIYDKNGYDCELCYVNGKPLLVSASETVTLEEV